MADQAIDPIDEQAGKKVRARRRMLGMSQTQLGEALGVTFQQAQKYERGLNRLSASTLWRVAQALRAPIPYFFPDQDDADVDEDHVAMLDLAGVPGGEELARGYVSLGSAARHSVLQVINAIVGARAMVDAAQAAGVTLSAEARPQ